ncbi:hypothetical protein Q8F55_000029 [Vanrija albida]|uniref:F-box domain-containing protein n=1 Tax=Vanrija albida TaxID=181172 RepID=A0ABR3QC32_9TREE
MPVLDHTAYPDIVDAVIAFADERSLVALRTASRAFRDRVDALLLPHVAIDLTHVPDIHLVSASTGARLPFCPGKVSCADVHASPLPGAGAQLQPFTSVRTLRRVGSGVTSDLDLDVPQVTTLVDYYDLHEVRAVMDGPLPSLEYYPFSGLQRYVLHLRVDAGSRPVGHMHELFPRGRHPDEQFPEFSEVIIVLHVPPAPSITTVHATLVAAGALVVDAVHRLEAGTRSLTIVGFDELAALQLPPGDEDHDERERFDDMLEIIGNMQSAVAADEPIFHTEPEPSTRFIGMEAWLAELGEKRELEGEWVGRW